MDRASPPGTDATPCPVCGGVGRYDFTGADLMYGGSAAYDYHRCGTCDAVYLVPMPGPEEIAGFYPEDYKVYDENVDLESPRAMTRAVLKTVYGHQHLEAPPLLRAIAPVAAGLTCRNSLAWEGGGAMLDIGCGNGRFLLRMRELGWDVQGVDFSPTAVEVCRRHGLTVSHGDLRDAQFPDCGFDLVTARHVIEHVPEPVPFMAEVVRVLKPGGRVHLRTPNSDALGGAMFGTCWYPYDVPRHVILYSRKTLSKLVAGVSLEPVLMRGNIRRRWLLNSMDYRNKGRGKPARKSRLRRMLGRLYVPLARLTGRPDELFAVYRASGAERG